MRTEFPVCRRCCFCLPLRYGLITWGYLKLILGILLAIFLIITLFDVIHMMMRYRSPSDVPRLTFVGVVLVILLVDIILNILFIIGGHMKNVKLLQVYYIYNLVLLSLTFLVVLLCLFLMVPSLTLENISYRSWLIIMDLCNSFVNMVMQIYFLLLLRSEIIKLESNCNFRFVNNAAEPECTMRSNEEVVAEKDTEDTHGRLGESEDTTCDRTCLCKESCHVEQRIN